MLQLYCAEIQLSHFSNQATRNDTKIWGNQVVRFLVLGNMGFGSLFVCLIYLFIYWIEIVLFELLYCVI